MLLQYPTSSCAPLPQFPPTLTHVAQHASGRHPAHHPVHRVVLLAQAAGQLLHSLHLVGRAGEGERVRHILQAWHNRVQGWEECCRSGDAKVRGEGQAPGLRTTWGSGGVNWSKKSDEVWISL